MRIPVIRGIIDRRILANFRIDPEVMARNLPAPFRPKLAGGYAIGGICLIRLKSIRPRFLPLPWGIGSENAAHRIAVEWDADGQTQQGVYIPRRDTDSRLNTWAGGSIFPGIHHHGKFTVEESDDHYSVALQSDDSDTHVLVAGKVTDQLPTTSVFASVAEASDFFEQGALGYSDTHTRGKYDGLELRCDAWQVEPLDIERVESSYFQNESAFPKGSVEFDCALLMRGIDHEWHGRQDLCCNEPAAMQ
ncbi:DUF2071 domain-containing protein [Aeoliella sp.]|uniref:DUF2071 domain-containing protein n=1 Tax=Aeoliella sp. TaxID=2795800 RepID=UPI003CCBF7B0